MEYKTDILAFGAHPDDIEFGCGALLIKMAKQGKSIVMVDLTLGDKGTNGTVEIRRQESEAAAQVIGAKRVFLNFKDCEIIDSYAGRLELVKIIREYKPRLVLASYWKGEENHPDHIACGVMARYACRYARFRKILPDLPMHKPEGILHYFALGNPDFLIDISDELEMWKKMMHCHKSQMETFNYGDWCIRNAARWGICIGVEYAQGLIKGNPVQVDDLMTIARTSREI